MRMDFKTYLTEAQKTVQQTSDQRTHSEHVNHLVFDGHESVAEAHEGLSKLHNFLTGAKTKIPKSLTTKVDGAPAFHFIKGDDGRIGLATKGLFNKNPKIAWNHEDISKHYGHAPGLEAIMHDLYDHGQKVLPKDMRPGEVYKGDALFGGDRKPESRDGHVSFMPNLLNRVGSMLGFADVHQSLPVANHQATGLDANGFFALHGFQFLVHALTRRAQELRQFFLR